jgi:hypothetical protein
MNVSDCDRHPGCHYVLPFGMPILVFGLRTRRAVVTCHCLGNWRKPVGGELANTRAQLALWNLSLTLTGYLNNVNVYGYLFD